MTSGLFNRLKFGLELQIQRGAFQQLLLMAFLIVFVAVSGGIAAWLLTNGFQNPAEAIWWAFLRLTDPGYLGDDEGYVLRVISTIVTVLGYVLFMGSLIAIMTQWLNRTIWKLEGGFTPISMVNHILILGWTNRTTSIVRELALSEVRVRRFLEGRGAKKLKIVILAETVSAELRQELYDAIGPVVKRSQVILRSGSSMRIEQLDRVDFMRASAIILPGADYAMGGAEGMDSRIIKTLMSISKFKQTSRVYPTVVAEIFDARKVRIAEEAYQGQIHVISGDAFISRLITQNIRHRGLSYVYSELLSHKDGNDIYVRKFPKLSGLPFALLSDLFPTAVVMGVIRTEATGFKPILNPPATFKLRQDDQLVVMARTYSDAAPNSFNSKGAIGLLQEKKIEAPAKVPRRRLLVLGWSHKANALIREIGSYPDERFDIDILSVVPVKERTSALKRIEIPDDQVSIRHVEGDYTFETELLQVDPGSYDNVIFLGADWLDSGEESDARTVLGYMLLHSVLAKENNWPDILVELKDSANERLFHEQVGEVMISPIILSHMLAHAALRKELTSVFNELFGPGSADISFRSATDYGFAGQEITFREIQQEVALYGEIALGVRTDYDPRSSESSVYLNPARQKTWQIEASYEIVVLALNA